MSGIIKAFKGFNKDMTCMNKQYEEGGSYTEKQEKDFDCGMHACEYPLDCFKYYAPGNSVYHKVEQGGQLNYSDNDTKVASAEMKIGERLDIHDLVKAAIEFIKSRTTTKHIDPERATAGKYGAATAGSRGAATAGGYGAATAGKYGAATAGNCGAATAGNCGAATAGNCGAATAGKYGAATAGKYGAATAGDNGAATAGYCGAATAGEYGAATAGKYGAATAGKYGAATAGKYGAATAGDNGAATAGYCGAATAGDNGTATSRGKSCTGGSGLSVARGNNVMVKGGLGALLVIAEENSNNYEIKNWKAAVVDGEIVKPDTWYRLDEEGNLTECKEEMSNEE